MSFDHAGLAELGDEIQEILRDNGEDPKIEAVMYTEIIARLVRCYRKLAAAGTEKVILSRSFNLTPTKLGFEPGQVVYVNGDQAATVVSVSEGLHPLYPERLGRE